ncbi:unnamed protein product [Blumeria hordei]|uniref:Uncharacterized protein n=1 Tax=Blumeria hordei TaxID=2867405 RepID=A0A383UXJ7_BLUHO|nr:unnamed protein product [Blumeria hordei]
MCSLSRALQSTEVDGPKLLNNSYQSGREILNSSRFFRNKRTRTCSLECYLFMTTKNEALYISIIWTLAISLKYNAHYFYPAGINISKQCMFICRRKAWQNYNLSGITPHLRS